MIPVERYWTQVNEEDLRQGDFLPKCLVPIFHPGYGDDSEQATDVTVKEYDLIVVTQSCDLASQKVTLVALSPLFEIAAFEEINTDFKKKGAWENVRKGRAEGLHLLASPESPNDNRKALVVDFREIYSLPFEYLTDLSSKYGDRWRLRSPFLEHFSQSFARFFMRVGLPSSIPSYK